VRRARRRFAAVNRLGPGQTGIFRVGNLYIHHNAVRAIVGK
jgi:hypothetical protein